MAKDFYFGQLVYLKNVGFPYDRTDEGHESFEGASAVVTGINVGASKRMIEVKFVIPMKTPTGKMITCLFHPESVKPENRPWLKKNLVKVLAFQKEVEKMAAFCNKMVEECP